MTRPEYCTKCKTSGDIRRGVEQPGVMMDIHYNQFGDFQRVEGVEKLKQEMIRAVLAIRTSNPREPSWGTLIEASIGSSHNRRAFAAALTTDIRRSLEFVMALHRIQARAQVVDPAEILDAILRVELSSDEEIRFRDVHGQRSWDPTAYYVSVVVRNQANDMVDFFVPLDAFTKDQNPVDLPQIEVRNLRIDNISQVSAEIIWETNIETDTIIDYGETEDLSSRESGGFGTRHFVALTGLKSDTLYYLKVVTRNRGFLYGASLRTFKTLP